MKKLFILFAVTLMNLSAFAAKDIVPSDTVLAYYYNSGDVCVCFYFPEVSTCNNFILTGSFIGWSDQLEKCVPCEPVEGYNGWYVGSFEAEVEPDAEKGIQAKPIMLDINGKFNWDYQVSSATIIRGGVQVVASGQSALEIDLINYSKDAPNVFIIEAFKKSCDYSYYTIYDGSNKSQGKIKEVGAVSINSYYQLTAVPNFGYHFTQWGDGVKDNPRIVFIIQDTTFTAEFEKNLYSLTTTSSSEELGIAIGDTTALYLDKLEISAVSNYGYHFTQWSDGVTDNPRTIELTQDTSFLAEFTKNIYTLSVINENPEKGITFGDTSALYLDQIEISAVPNYGYHFTQWTDRITDNPRSIKLTQDTILTAEFAQNPVINYIFNSLLSTKN